MVCVMRKVTNSKSLENFYFYCCCLNRVCHFIDNDLKKKIIKFLFLKGIYVHAYIVYRL